MKSFLTSSLIVCPRSLCHDRELFKSRLWRSPEVWELAKHIF